MSDRELLELAAKAAWIEVFLGRFGSKHALMIDAGLNGYIPWNPLTDDGDALRLAVRLELNVRQCPYAVQVGHDVDYEIVNLHEPVRNDRTAATRRAIVRAAAEIGMAQP